MADGNENPITAIVPQIVEHEDEHSRGSEDPEHDELVHAINNEDAGTPYRRRVSGSGYQRHDSTQNAYSRHNSAMSASNLTRNLSSAQMDRYYSEVQFTETQGRDVAAMSRHSHTMPAGARLKLPTAAGVVQNMMNNAYKENDPAEMSRHASAMMIPRKSSMMLTHHSSLGLGEHRASFLGIRNPSSIQLEVTDDGMIVERRLPPSDDGKIDKNLSLHKRIYKKFKNSPYVNNFMKGAEWWYKAAIVFFLILNPIIFAVDPIAAGWLLLIEFIGTLAMAMQNYPLEPGGLLAFEALAIGMTTTDHVIHEIEKSLDVVLLLIFMVAATHFLKRMLLFCFAYIFLSINSKILLSTVFACIIGLMSAFLDALTVAAVMISVVLGYIGIYNEFRMNELQQDHDGDGFSVDAIKEVNGDTHDMDDMQTLDPDGKYTDEKDQFYSFLRDVLIHGIMATAYGGAITSVGEPQNLVVAGLVKWEFDEFFYRNIAVTFTVLAMALITLVIVEMTGIFGFGNQFPPAVREILTNYKDEETKKMTASDKAQLKVQIIVSLFIVIALAVQLAPVGIIGLAAIVLVTTFNGYTEEHDLGKAFQDSMPFLSLLIVFFTIVAVIDTQGMFDPILNWILDMDSLSGKILAMFLINGALSMVSDNVFVATVFANELTLKFCHHSIDASEYNLLSVAVLSGVNILGVGTPNGSASFLYLLTSHLAPLVGLSYGRMFYMCLPYTIMMTVAGLLTNLYLVPMSHESFEASGVISTPSEDDFCHICSSLSELCFGGSSAGGH